MAGFGGGQAMRLGGNIILTRLLFPEAFGLMALVGAVLQGLRMFSDLGVEQGVIQSNRHAERRFLDTAWTMQILRGGGVWVIAAAFAWPMAILYEQSALLWLIPLCAVSALLQGFNSVAMATAQRDMAMHRVVGIELRSQFVGLAVMLAWAAIHPSVVALAAGALSGSAAKMVLSHVALGRGRPSLAWDRESVKELFRFGKWVFLASAMGFLASKGDALILGKFLAIDMLGVYVIGATFATFASQAYAVMSQRVLFPLYVRLRHDEPSALRRNILRVRAGMLALFAPGLWLLIVFGQDLIRLLYDPRYAEAGWVLQVLAAGVLALIIPSVGPVHLAQGRSRTFALTMAARSAGLLASMAVGGALFGEVGLVVGVAASSLVYLPVEWWVARRYRVWVPWFDLAAMGVSAAVVALGLWLRFGGAA
jgi:O-antigen/teichoic acid export membrane protein